MTDEPDGLPLETAGDIAELYLGNILYALELTSASLVENGKSEDAAFYRGIARKLAQAHGAAKRRGAIAVTNGMGR